MALNLPDLFPSLQSTVEAHELFGVYIHWILIICGEMLLYVPQLQTELLEQFKKIVSISYQLQAGHSFVESVQLAVQFLFNQFELF